MSKRSLAIISGVALIIVGIVVGFVLYGKNQVAKAPSPSEEYVAEKNEQAIEKQSAREEGVVLGAETGGMAVKSEPISATPDSANIIQSVAERLESLKNDLVALRESENGRANIAIELEALKQELLAIQTSNSPATESAGALIGKTAAKIARIQETELTASAHRADLMITITAIGERLIALGKLTIAYQEALRTDNPENANVLVGVSYQ